MQEAILAKEKMHGKLACGRPLVVVKTQAKSPLTRSNLNLRLIVEDKEHERKKRR
jgi:hypothetical protein